MIIAAAKEEEPSEPVPEGPTIDEAVRSTPDALMRVQLRDLSFEI